MYHIYILYNNSYGSFAMNRKFIIELFKYVCNTANMTEIFNIEKLNTTKEEILKKILKKIKDNDTESDKHDDIESDKHDDTESDNHDDNIEYFSDYMITKNKIYNFKNNTCIYISPYQLQLRSNQFVIEYIFERCVKKIIKDDNFTPFFYKFLSNLKPELYATKLESSENTQLINLDLSLLEEINKFSYEYKLHNIFTNTDVTNIQYYKNGIKINDEYYKFKFDTNLNKDNIFDILDNLRDYLFFHDINYKHSNLNIEKIKSCYEWNIHEYDGKESIIIKLPYVKIITDLLNKLWNTENYERKSILSDDLINKIKTLEEIREEMYS